MRIEYKQRRAVFTVLWLIIGETIATSNSFAVTLQPKHVERRTNNTTESVSPQQIIGHWLDPEWGEMVLQQVGTEIWGTYNHDQGTLIGTLGADGVLRGWWCEVPSRSAPQDAGEFEFTFVRNSSGGLSISGRWRYGTTEPWRDNWDLEWIAGPAPLDLQQRFADHSAFLRHP